ncbi:MAG: hypothetical protein ACK5LZ_02085 [Anaerorhabdus sp.]
MRKSIEVELQSQIMDSIKNYSKRTKGISFKGTVVSAIDEYINFYNLPKQVKKRNDFNKELKKVFLEKMIDFKMGKPLIDCKKGLEMTKHKLNELESNKVKLIVTVNEEVHERFKTFCVTNNKIMKNTVEEAMLLYIDSHEEILKRAKGNSK